MAPIITTTETQSFSGRSLCSILYHWLMLRVLAVHDGGSGCAWYRMLLPYRALEDDPEVEVTFRSAGQTHPDLQSPHIKNEDAEGKDIVVGQRISGGLGMWRRWRTPERKTVYEVDDDLFSVDRSNTASYYLYEEGSPSRFGVERALQAASRVTVSTEHLAEVMSEKTEAPVSVLPNFIPEYVLDMQYDKREGRLRVGWIGGDSHSRDIDQCANGVRQFLKRFPDWDLYNGGKDYLDRFKVSSNRAFRSPWINVALQPDLYYRSIDFDIGLCPLLDTKFSRSKSHIKALEYMARGIPVVASDVEPYRRFVDHGVNGFLVKHEHEWLKYLSILASDEDLRWKMSVNAKYKATQHTIEGNAHLWKEALCSR